MTDAPLHECARCHEPIIIGGHVHSISEIIEQWNGESVYTPKYVGNQLEFCDNCSLLLDSESIVVSITDNQGKVFTNADKTSPVSIESED